MYATLLYTQEYGRKTGPLTYVPQTDSERRPVRIEDYAKSSELNSSPGCFIDHRILPDSLSLTVLQAFKLQEGQLQN